MSVVREKARETGLGESVSMLIDICPEDTAQQLQFCLDQLEQPASETDPSLGDSEDEEEEVCDSSDVEVDEYFVCVSAKMFIFELRMLLLRKKFVECLLKFLYWRKRFV